DSEARRGALSQARDRDGDQTAPGLRPAAGGRIRAQGLPAAVRVDGDPRQGLLHDASQVTRGTAVTMVEQRDWTRGGLHFRDVTVTVPFDHFGRSGDAASAGVNLPDTLNVFARIIATEADSRKPYLVYLQGGPGVEAP